MEGADDIPIRVKSWDDLADLVAHFSYYSAHAWLFRGVTDRSHALIPKVGRETSRAKKKDPKSGISGRVPYRLEDERAIFQMFKQQARSYLSIPPATDLEWLAIAQHFGLPTRLLDWTESLLVAAWFAVEEGGSGDREDAAIWVTRGLPSLNAESNQDPLSVPDPAIYRPAYVSGRIAAQASVLMICPAPTTAVRPAFVRQIRIARDVEFTLKKRLNTCGINKRQLFPDLGGLADHLGWLYRRDYLAGYSDANTFTVAGTPDDDPAVY